MLQLRQLYIWIFENNDSQNADFCKFSAFMRANGLLASNNLESSILHHQSLPSLQTCLITAENPVRV